MEGSALCMVKLLVLGLMGTLLNIIQRRVITSGSLRHSGHIPFRGSFSLL